MFFTIIFSSQFGLFISTLGVGILYLCMKIENKKFIKDKLISYYYNGNKIGLIVLYLWMIDGVYLTVAEMNIIDFEGTFYFEVVSVRLLWGIASLFLLTVNSWFWRIIGLISLFYVSGNTLLFIFALSLPNS